MTALEGMGKRKRHDEAEAPTFGIMTPLVLGF